MDDYINHNHPFSDDFYMMCTKHPNLDDYCPILSIEGKNDQKTSNFGCFLLGTWVSGSNNVLPENGVNLLVLHYHQSTQVKC